MGSLCKSRYRGAALALALLCGACAPPQPPAECPGGTPCEVSDILDRARGKTDAVAPASWLWPNGDVYLLVDDSDTGWWSSFRVDRALRGAAEELADNTAVRLHFIEDPAEASHGFFVRLKGQPDGGGWAHYGTTGDEAEADARSVRHEIGHILGLAHTQQRGDRDEVVRIHWRWIEDGEEHNFDKATWTVVGPYDLESVMQYRSFSFSTPNADGNDCATITPRELEVEAEDCVTRSLWDWVGFGSLIDSEAHYSDWNYTVIAALYCDARFCGENCAPRERCEAPATQRSLQRLYDWEQSDEGRAWRARHPHLAP